LAQEREQVVAMSPQVLGQPLVSRVRLWREDQVGQLVPQSAAGHGQAVPADLARRVTVPEVHAGSEQFGHPAREADGSACRRRLHGVGAPQPVVEAWLVPGVLEAVLGATVR
jgi:hypothetical protein